MKMFKKLLLALICLSCFISISYAEDGDSCDVSTDPLCHYKDDLYDSAISGDKDSRTSFFRTEDICQVIVNESDVTNFDTALIHEIRNQAKEDEVPDDESTGEKIQYYFSAKSKYFGVYDELEDAVTACKLVFNSANNLKRALWNGERTFYYVQEGTTGGHDDLLVINKDCKEQNPDEPYNCVISPIKVNREEALSRFFTIINRYYPEIKHSEYWTVNKPDENEEYENYLDKVQFRSLAAGLANKVFDKRLTSGEILAFDRTAYKKRADLNEQIYKGVSSRVSAYQRFGPEIRFVPYFGEQSFDINILDKILSAWSQDKLDQITDNLQDLQNESSVYLSTVVYKDRAPVLTSNDVKDGLMDPRVDAYMNFMVGAHAAVGNLYLTISKFIFSIISLFLENTIANLLWDTIEALEKSEVWVDVFGPSVAVLTVIGMCAFIFSLVRHAKRYGFGQEDARPFMGRIFGGILTLGIMTLLIINPTAVNVVPKKITTIVNDIAGYTLARDPNAWNDDVVGHNDTGDGFMSAAVWRRCIFDPWCEGTFLDKYENLWTMYADGEHGAMEQSYQDKEELGDRYHDVDEQGNVTFDSAGMTGDIGVPLGGGYVSKNWAIFAWSTQSVFHIDSNERRYVYMNEEGEEIQREEVNWPNATTAAGNNNIYADDFKWIDAKLNISYQYGEGGHKTPNYTDARSYTERFESAGKTSIYMALMLMTLLPTIYTKYSNFVYLIIISARIIVAAIENLFREKTFTKVFPEYVKHIKEYLMASVKLAILVILYYKLANIYSVENCILFVFLSITIQLVNIDNFRTSVRIINQYLETGEIDSNNIQTRDVAFIDMSLPNADNDMLEYKYWYRRESSAAAAKAIEDILNSDDIYHEKGLRAPTAKEIEELCTQREEECIVENDTQGILHELSNFRIRWANENRDRYSNGQKDEFKIHKNNNLNDEESENEDENNDDENNQHNDQDD